MKRIKKTLRITACVTVLLLVMTLFSGCTSKPDGAKQSKTAQPLISGTAGLQAALNLGSSRYALSTPKPATSIPPLSPYTNEGKHESYEITIKTFAPPNQSFSSGNTYESISMQPVDSTCFSHVGYDKANRILKVRFRDSKSVYIYKNIPNEVYRALINASSIGSYYNNYIKNKYEYVRIE